MVELGDHHGITPGMAFTLCRMFDDAATNVSGIEPPLWLSLRRVADTIQDRHTWAPHARTHQESSCWWLDVLDGVA